MNVWFLSNKLCNNLDRSQQAHVQRMCRAISGCGENCYQYIGTIKKNTYLYRATDFHPKSIVDIKYPPVKGTKLGRCNFPKHPVLYITNSILGALMEKSVVFRGEDTKKTESVYISKWQVIEDIYVAQFFFISPLNTACKDLKEEITFNYDKIKGQFENDIEIIDCLTFSSENFVLPNETGYPYSSIVSNILYGITVEGRFLSGVAYVGAQFDYTKNIKPHNYENYALIQSVVKDKKIIPVDVMHFIISPNDISVELVEAIEQCQHISMNINFLPVRLRLLPQSQLFFLVSPGPVRFHVLRTMESTNLDKPSIVAKQHCVWLKHPNYYL